jgi:hypothetical protein
MSSANQPEDLDLIATFVADLHDGVITPAEMARFNDLLLASPEGRRRFLEHAQLDAGLHWIFSSRKEVATVIDDAAPVGARPIAEIAEQQLRFADDPRFSQVAAACAANESHLQDWLQIFPRLLATTALCTSAASHATDPVEVIAAKLVRIYSPDWSSSAFWGGAKQATVQSLMDESGQDGEIATFIAELCTAAFEPPGARSILDVFSIHEILDESIPQRLPAGALRVLCLRYLNGLAPRRIALHLDRPATHVAAYLAKTRVHLAGKCLVGSGTAVTTAEIGDLLQWSMYFDAATSEERARWASIRRQRKGAANPTHLLLLAMVHDYLSRQLSTARLLEEVSSRKNKSYLLAVEQSLRDIETLGTPFSSPIARVGAGQKPSRTALHVAALLGVAAGLLIAVGLGALAGVPPIKDRSPAIAEIAEKSSDAPSTLSPSQTVPEKAAASPPRPPVVAVVSEVIGVPSENRNRLAVGSMVRIDDVLTFETGIVQLSTTGGSHLVLEGPVEAVVAAKDRLVLRRGKITGLNESAGEQLVIDSPKSSIVDVGTEFGVSVGEADETSIAVYDGEVRLEPIIAAGTGPRAEPMPLKAGWETSISATAAAPAEPVLLAHDREFIRSDEVELRKAAESGDLDSDAQVRFFELLRIKDLIAYQGFHDGATEGEFTLGFRAPYVRLTGEATYQTDMQSVRRPLGRSNSLSTGLDGSAYLDIDTGERSRLVRAALTEEGGMIGSRPGELWLCWRTRAVGAPDATFRWGGTSLMFGDNRGADEALFIGQPAPMNHFGLHAFPGKGESPELLASLDKDRRSAGEQLRKPDFEQHLWILKLKMDGSAAEASVWCDVQPSDVDRVPPEATQVLPDFRFDRLRLEAVADSSDGRWLFDDVIIALSSDAIAKTLQLVDEPALPEAL